MCHVFNFSKLPSENGHGGGFPDLPLTLSRIAGIDMLYDACQSP